MKCLTDVYGESTVVNPDEKKLKEQEESFRQLNIDSL